ncbi:Partitioning defective 3 [Sparganum proliferum]
MENAKCRSNSPTADEENTLRLHKCSSSTASTLVGPAGAYQGDFTHAVGEVGAMALRKRNPTALILTIEALTLARDGGILDWDDQVSDVLDDRELLLAKYKWDAPTSKPGAGVTQQSRVKVPSSIEQASPPTDWQSPNTTSHASAAIGAPCNGDLLDCTATAQVAGTSIMHIPHRPLHCQSSPDLGCRPLSTAAALKTTQISSPSSRRRTPSPVKHPPHPPSDAGECYIRQR